MSLRLLRKIVISHDFISFCRKSRTGCFCCVGICSFLLLQHIYTYCPFAFYKSDQVFSPFFLRCLFFFLLHSVCELGSFLYFLPISIFCFLFNSSLAQRVSWAIQSLYWLHHLCSNLLEADLLGVGGWD